MRKALHLPQRCLGARSWATLERLEVDPGMPQTRLSVPPARVLDERAARHGLSQGARRAHHDAGLLPADKDGGPRPAARELGPQPVGTVRPHKGDHVPLRYGAAVTVIGLVELLGEMEARELRPREPGTPHERVAEGDRGRDEGAGSAHGEHERALDDGAPRDPRPLRKGLESDLRPEGDAAERVDAPAELAVDEGDELGGVFLDRGERAVRAGVPVEHGEHDAVPVGGEQVGDGPVVPPREAAPVQEHRRPRARAERVSDHLDPFDGGIARAAPLEAPAGLGRRMGARLFSPRAPHYTGGAREFSTLGLSARSSRHETLWNTGRRFARSAGRLSINSRDNMQNRWWRCVRRRSSRL